MRITAQANLVAVFGMVQPRDEFPHVGMNRAFVPERMFDSLCELSGGLVLAANQTALEAKLMEFVTMVRGRYIVEFPRPINGVAGFHNMEITIAGARKAFIRVAGDSMSREDPAISKDPNTVPEDPANAPQYGNRKVLAPR